MPFTGRYHLVRNWWLPTSELSPLLVLDRHARTLNPYKDSSEARVEWEPRDDRRAAVRKWQQHRQRVAAEPTLRHKARLAERLVSRDRDLDRVAALFGKGDQFPFRLLLEQPIGTLTTIALDSNYVAGASGDAIGGRFLTPVGGKTLNSIYFFVSSYTGTAANVNDLDLELRPEASAGAGTPDTSTLTASATKDPASATGWVASTGWTAALSALTRYFLIVGDADGNGTDYATVLARSSGPLDTALSSNNFTRYTPVSTTGGWASGNTASATTAVSVVLGFSDSTAYGNPFSVSAAPASDTNRRGLRITTSGLIANVPIFGAIWTAVNANISGMEIYNNANAPGTSPADTSTDLLFNSSSGRLGCLTSGGTPYSLVAGTAYRIVATYSGATANGPQRLDIGTGEDATLRKAMPGAGEFYYTRADGTTDWANDLVGSLPAMGLLVDGQVAASGRGIASLIHGGLVK